MKMKQVNDQLRQSRKIEHDKALALEEEVRELENERDAAYEAIRLLYNSLAVFDKIEADKLPAVQRAKEAKP